MTEVLMAMGDVRNRLARARNSMNTSQADLKRMFDKHVDLFDRDDIMKNLQDLAANLNACFDGAKDGMETVETTIEWLKNSGSAANAIEIE
jgi:hypothetical protein